MPRPHVFGDFCIRKFFYAYTKISASTRSVYESYTTVHMYPMWPESDSQTGVTCGLSLLVLYSALRGFSPGTPVLPSPQKSISDLICVNLSLFRFTPPISGQRYRTCHFIIITRSYCYSYIISQYFTYFFPRGTFNISKRFYCMAYWELYVRIIGLNRWVM